LKKLTVLDPEILTALPQQEEAGEEEEKAGRRRRWHGNN